MDLPPKLPPKKDVLIAFLAESSVFIHLDPRRDGVLVPKWFQKQPDLVLQIGLNMPIAIMDLDVGDTGVSCTLSFSRSPFWCHIPWHAIFALRAEKDHRGMVWPDDVPPDSQLLRASPAAPKPQKPKLQAVQSVRPTAVKRMSEEERRARGLDDDEEELETGTEVEAEPAAETPPPKRGPAVLTDVSARDVPPSDAPPPRDALRAVPTEPAEAPADAAPAEETPSTEAPPSDGPGGKKGKRPLPPYLRVVK